MLAGAGSALQGAVAGEGLRLDGLAAGELLIGGHLLLQGRAVTQKRREVARLQNLEHWLYNVFFPATCLLEVDLLFKFLEVLFSLHL